MIYPFRFKVGDSVKLNRDIKTEHGHTLYQEGLHGKIVRLTLSQRGTSASVRFGDVHILVSENALALT